MLRIEKDIEGTGRGIPKSQWLVGLLKIKATE
jgi:hypothetical protein